MKYKILILSVIYCMKLQAFDRLIFHTIDIQAGLSDNFIRDITQDQYGFMWFATSNGINRYDGYHMKRYIFTDVGAYNNDVEEVAEDKGGTLWLKTPAGYYFYNRTTDKIDNRLSGLLEPLGIQGEVKKLVVDEDAHLWCVVSDTLFHYNYTQEQLYKLPLTGKEEILCIVSRNQQPYMLTATGHIYKVDLIKNTLPAETHIPLSNYEEHNMYMDYDLNIWFYTKHSPESSLQFYNTKTGQWSNPLKKDTFKGAYTVHLTDDGKGNIWIGTNNNGIYIYQHKQDKLLHIDKNKNDAYSLPDVHIWCFYKDNRNNMWIGTSKRGVVFTNLDKMTFESYTITGQEDVNAILEDHAGCLWIGSDGEGLSRFNPVTRQINHYREAKGHIPSDNVVCLFEDSKKRLWVGTFGGGVGYYENNRFHPLHYTDSTETGDPLQYIRCITEDEYGNIWIGTIQKGLYRYDTERNLTAFTVENSILPTGSITDLIYYNQLLYIGTSSGLYTMETQTSRIDFIMNDPEINTYLSNIVLTCIYFDSRGFLWIGGEKGISIYDGTRNKLIKLSEDKKWSFAKVRGITEDKNKNIWVTTDLGITNIVVVYDPETPMPEFRCYHHSERDGLGNQTFNTHAIYTTPTGEILVGGTNGLVRIHPQIIRNNFYNPRVIFTALYWSNQLIETGDTLPDGRVLLKKNIQLSDEITVDYSDNFALEVSAMNYEAQHTTHFLYRLSNKDEWIGLSDNRIYFHKLPPGTHQIQVKIANGNGDWSSAPSFLTIHVRPPFWLSIPAYLSYLLLAIGCIIYATLRIRRKHRLSMEIQRKEMELSKQQEMEEAKARFFTNISHDLRTPLSLIITPLEKLLTGSGNHNKEDIELIHRNAQLLMNQVNQLLDFRKLENKKGELHTSHGNLSDFIKEICRDFESYSQRKGIDLTLRIKSPVLNFDFDRNKMQRIFMNLLSNAFKYNTENGSITVTIEQIAGPEGPQAKIQVADTGIGIRDENKEKVFDRFYQEHHSAEYMGSGIGLHIVKEYIHMHGGEIRIKDNHPKGTIFIVTFPLPSPGEEVVEIIKNGKTKTEEENVQDGRISILIVEDNDDFRSFLINSLKDQYQIFHAPDGKKALTILARETIDMVISDVMMPVMDGLKLCNKIKNDIRFSHIPIILLTARSREEHIVDGLKQGADDYITKPFNLDILLLRIKKLLEWKQENHKKFPLVDVSPGEITISTLDEQLIEKCIKLVEENMNNMDFSVEDLSIAVGMTRGHLYKKLISITGKSPFDFICTLRIKRGHQLLEKSQLSISEIAYQIGLAPKQFSKHFKDEYGCLPSEFRKKNE